jgi:hypothetical protein
MDNAPSLSTAQVDFAASPLLADMLEDMAAAIPARETDTPERIDRRHQAARAMVMSLHPADAIEAAMAISAAVAYYTSLTLRVRAAHPRTTPLEAAALGRIAMAEQRAFNVAVRDLQKRHAPVEAPRPRASRAQQQSATAPVPPIKGATVYAAERTAIVAGDPQGAAVRGARHETVPRPIARTTPAPAEHVAAE